MTAKAKSYAEKLRDPRWQRKRLEVMQSAGWACELCGDEKTTLNVHHRHYRRGAEPWDYKRRELQCLCEPCHTLIHSKPQGRARARRKKTGFLTGVLRLLGISRS